MNLQVSAKSESIDRASFNQSSLGECSRGSDFLSLLSSLLSSGAEGENALITLLKSNSEDSSSTTSLDSYDESSTIGSLINTLNLRVNGEGSLKLKNNFILGEGEIKDILDSLKNLSQNNVEGSLSQYINGINEENGFLKLKAMQNLNSQAQNSNLASTIQGMITSIGSNNLGNKDVLNALKFLQQFTNKDGSLDTAKLLESLETGSKAKDASTFMNSMNLSQGNNTGATNTIPVKEVNIFKNSDIVDVVVENFKTLRLPGRCEMRIKLNPAELGEVTIKLVLEKGQVNAVVSADRKDTFALLQSNINNLLEQLKQSGTDIHHIAINLSEDKNGEEARRGYKQEKDESSEDEFENIFDEISTEDESVDALI